MEALNIEIIRNTKEAFMAELSIIFRKLESESLLTFFWKQRDLSDTGRK